MSPSRVPPPASPPRRRSDTSPWRHLVRGLAGLAVLGAVAAHADTPDDRARNGMAGAGLRRPVACLPRCRVIKLVDRDPRAGMVRDVPGGERATDGHAGIDIAAAAMVPGQMSVSGRVLVLAVESGRVVAVRTGMADRDARAVPRWWLAGREGGNVVVVDHGDGLRSDYAHLAEGSISVRVGDRVRRGQVLGRPGMSGYAAFEHVEFRLILRGRVVDPVADGILTMAQLEGAGDPAR